jgi:uncharacterized protein YbjT (DUF2867 family)
MARALIVGCGCRGRGLGERLIGEGWAVRGTSRRQAALAEIEGAGIEASLADPDRPGTLLELVGDVTAVVWLLGSAQEEAERLEAIHGPRLERTLERLVDTPVRGFVYEGAGTAPARLLEQGAAVVRAASRRWRIPVAVIEADPADPDAWTEAASDAVLGLAFPAGEAGPAELEKDV